MNVHYVAFLGSGRVTPPDAIMLVPVLAFLLIDAALIFYCLDDLNRREIVTDSDKRWWATVIILGGPVGQFYYWLYGRGPR